jgi:DNA-binding transcriptional regulator LsrR (DeoR family)
VRPIRAVLAGGLLGSLVIDEETAAAVLETTGRDDHVA